MTREEVKEFVKSIKVVWPKFDASNVTVDAWFPPLEKLSYEDCIKALLLYQNPRNDEEIRRCAFAPHPGDIYALVKEIEDERISVRTEVLSCARRAVDNFPSNGEEERRDGKNLFYARCMAQPDAARAARVLERELDETRKVAANTVDKDGKDFTQRLKPITQIIMEYAFT